MAQWINYDSVLAQITGYGIIVKGGLDVGTPRPVKCFVEGEREKRGWYRLYDLTTKTGDTLIVGSYGIWRGNDPGTQKVRIDKEALGGLDADQLAAMKARVAEDRKRAEAERHREAEAAAAKAGAWWRQCQDAGESAYLARKGLGGKLYGARISKSGNLVIPIQDGDGKTWGLQVIYSDPAIKARKGRDKDYTPPGLDKRGKWHQIGSPMGGGTILLCEGFATGASLHEATGLPVAVAFDAGSLLPVAQALRRRYKACRILVCADDDYLTTPNTGVVAAEAAALAVEGGWVAPVFPGERSTDKARKGPTDFNDLHVHPDGGLSAVRTQIEGALGALGWDAPRTSRGVPATRGAGDSEDGKRPEAVSTLPLDALVERFIHVDDDTGEVAFDTWTRALCKFTKVVKMLPARVRTDDIKDHPRWKSRAVYIDQIGFDPGGEDPNILCNRWAGWPLKPVEGRCDLLLDTLRYYSAQEDNAEQVYRWMLCWLAYPLQHAGAKMHSAMVIHGPQGTGKSRFFEAYAKIYGDYATVLNQGAIEDKFNSDWSERKLFILADEIVARQDLYHLKNQLKNFITGEWVRVNPKNVAAHRERNHMNLVFLSNERQPVQLENDDRRHLVLWTPPALSRAYYDELSEEIACGGVLALYHYLMQLDLGDFRPWTRPPMTRAKEDLIGLSLSSEERFCRDWAAGETDWPYGPCASMDLYAAYRKYCAAHGVQKPRESNQFLGHVGKLPGWSNDRRHRYDTTAYLGKTIQTRMVIPAGHEPPPGKTLSQWLTDAHFAFQTALNPTGSYA